MVLKREITLTLLVSIIALFLCGCAHRQDKKGNGTDKPPRSGEVIDALDRYHRKFSRYPEKISELFPDFIASLPTQSAWTKDTYNRTKDGYVLSFPKFGGSTSDCTYEPKTGWICRGCFDR